MRIWFYEAHIDESGNEVLKPPRNKPWSYANPHDETVTEELEVTSDMTAEYLMNWLRKGNSSEVIPKRTPGGTEIIKRTILVSRGWWSGLNDDDDIESLERLLESREGSYLTYNRELKEYIFVITRPKVYTED